MKLIKFFLIPTIGMAIALSGCQTKTINIDIKTEADSMSYALGIYNAAGMKQGDIENINVIAVAKGLQDAYSDKEDVMTPEEAVEFLNSYFNKERVKKSEKNLEEGKKFLEDNAKNEGVIVDSTGIQYKVIVEGNGPRPVETDMVRVHYHGTRIDGTVFDSSVEKGEPAQFFLNRVIRGWTIGVSKMTVGSKYIFYIPADLAYGTNPRQGGVIQPNDVLVFEVELLGIVEDEGK